MPTPKRLTPEEVRDALASLSGWSLEQGKLHREYIPSGSTSTTAWWWI
jgi:hypothetical protein